MTAVPKPPFRLDGKVAAITGAASGIGKAIAGRFAQQGAAIAILDVDGPAAEVVAADLAQHGTDTLAVACDVARDTQVRAAFAQAEVKVDLRIVQQPLNVYMRVRHPVDEHGTALRAILRNGAARIERLLRESRHVHFAWFEFLEDGHVLALHTVFDGDFEAYLQHFAFEADTLFDELFKHLEPGLKRPVGEAPEDFVRTVLAHHRPAAGHFFFSAYPDDGAPRVLAALAYCKPCKPGTP